MAEKNTLKRKKRKGSAFSSLLNDNIFVILAFICAAALMMIVYYCFDVIPFGDKTILRMDLFHQYGPLFGELHDRITGFKSFIYSWTSGGGSSFLGNYFNYLSSPIAFIVLLFGHENIPESIGAMVLIKNALAASTMAYYLKKAHGKNDFSLTAFGLMYAFCGFFIAYYWNVMWIDAMYLLPLVVLGLEKIVKEKKAKLYVVALALTFLSNYYMAFMVCIFAVMYFLAFYAGNFRFKDYDTAPRQKETKDGKKVNLKRDCFFRSKLVRTGALFASSSILAAALTAFALIPTYFILQACSATSGTMPQTLENYNNIFDFLANHLASVVPTIRSSGDTVIPSVYSGLLTVILIPLYLMCKKISVKEKAATTALLAVFFACFNFNIPNFIIHAFHFPNDLPFRFSFIYSFFLIITAYKALIHIKDFTGKELLSSGLAVLAFIILTEKLGQGNVELVTVAISVIFTVIYVLVLWLMKNPSYYQPTVALLLMCCVFAEAAIADTNRFEITQLKPNFVNGYSEFRTMKESLDKQEGNDYYRMELTNINTLMDNCWFGYNGVSIFSSMAYEKLSNLQDDLGIKSNYINSYVYHLQTPVYNAMMSLKYIVDNNSYTMNTDIYDYISTTGSFSAYKNKYYLPIAYSVNSDIKDWDASDNDDPFKVQNDYWSLASGIRGNVFKRVPVSDAELSNLNDVESTFIGTQFHYSKIDGSSTANATVSYVLAESGNFYTYVDSKAFEDITVNCGDFSQSQNINEPYILDLGYHEQGEVITIDMPISADYTSGNIDCYVYKLNEDVFKEGYDILSKGAMEISEFTDTTIKGTVTVSDGGMLYTSIPYDEGWSVTVDGKAAEITDIADNALLAVETGAGEHEIEFTYHAKGLAQGAVISGAALIFSILFIIINNNRKKRVKVPAPQPALTAQEENTVTGIDALMAQDLGPDATAEDSEALLNPEREIVIEEITEEQDNDEFSQETEQTDSATENDSTQGTNQE